MFPDWDYVYEDAKCIIWKRRARHILPNTSATPAAPTPEAALVAAGLLEVEK